MPDLTREQIIEALTGEYRFGTHAASGVACTLHLGIGDAALFADRIMPLLAARMQPAEQQPVTVECDECQGRGYIWIASKRCELCAKCDSTGLAHRTAAPHPPAAADSAQPDKRDARIAALREAQWISVDDQLPEIPEGDIWIECIVTTAHGLVVAMSWSRPPFVIGEGGRAPRWEWMGRIASWRVTHWMPLPAPAHNGDDHV